MRKIIRDLIKIHKNCLCLRIELDQEDDGRCIADIPCLPGVMVYDSTTTNAIRGVTNLAEKVIKEMQSCGEIQNDLRIAYKVL